MYTDFNRWLEPRFNKNEKRFRAIMQSSWNLGLVAVIWLVLIHASSASSELEDHDAKKDSIKAVLVEPSEIPARKRRPQSQLKPKCPNFLRAVLSGRWVKKEPPYSKSKRKVALTEMKNQKIQLDNVMKSVWRKRGIPQNPWHSTSICGYYRLRRTVGGKSKKWPPIGTWCDPNGPNPCCDNILAGRCTNVPQGTCTCPKCVDVRSMEHAELMDWVPYNHWCKWNQYDASDACDVIENSPVKELYFVGDSFMQDMYMSLLMTLTGKPIKGMWKKGTFTQEELSKCSDYGLTYFKECRQMTYSFDDMLYRDSLCGDGRNITFKAEFKKYYNEKFGSEFKKFAYQHLGKKGTYIVVGIGFHIRMNVDLAIKKFLNPVIRMVKNYYRYKPQIPITKRWPKFLFSLPMTYGILKPTRYLNAQYITKEQAFEVGMRRYCGRQGIPVLNFNPLTKNVLTFDGIHYGVGVNNAKVQIFLNYLATLPTP